MYSIHWENHECLNMSIYERYLKVEIDHPIHGQRYRDIFLALKSKLSLIHIGSKHQQSHNSQSKLLQLGSKKAFGNTRTMWNVLERQDKFMNNIIACQLESRETRGKKDLKEKHLRASLKKNDYHTITETGSIPLPSEPQIWVSGVKAESAKMFKSALYPALLEFYIDRSETTQIPNMQTSKLVMVKTGDDLRQDQLVIMLIKLMDRILKRGTLDLHLKPYSILAMSDRAGLGEC